MSMNRRDFVKFVALLAAGAAAAPEQIQAFERYYDANTPQTTEELASVDEVFVAGQATSSTLVRMLFFPNSPSGPLRLGMNAFGGIVRWTAMPDQKIIILKRYLTWSLEPGPVVDAKNVLSGHISYINQAGQRINQNLI